MVLAIWWFGPETGEFAVAQLALAPAHRQHVTLEHLPVRTLANPDARRLTLARPDHRQQLVEQAIAVDAHLAHTLDGVFGVRLLLLQVINLKAVARHVARGKKPRVRLAQRHDELGVGLDVRELHRDPVLRHQRRVARPEVFQCHPLVVHHHKGAVHGHTAHHEVAINAQIDPHHMGMEGTLGHFHANCVDFFVKEPAFTVRCR